MRPIVIYTTTDDVAPHLRCIAKFKDGGKLLPLVIHGATPEQARENAEQWWSEEQQRQERIGMRKPVPAAPPAAISLGLLPC